jgi:hypothetical protein
MFNISLKKNVFSITVVRINNEDTIYFKLNHGPATHPSTHPSSPVSLQVTVQFGYAEEWLQLAGYVGDVTIIGKDICEIAEILPLPTYSNTIKDISDKKYNKNLDSIIFKDRY